MTSKTFKSSTGRSLTIEPSDGHDIGLATAGSFLALKIEDAPALALAILEAAGVESPYYNLKDAVDNLRQHVEREAQHAAEARELAELEAEALELYKAHTGYTHAKKLVEAAAPDRWLAVARRARELAKEATK